jgi:hypothetical protein
MARQRELLRGIERKYSPCEDGGRGDATSLYKLTRGLLHDATRELGASDDLMRSDTLTTTARTARKRKAACTHARLQYASDGSGNTLCTRCDATEEERRVRAPKTCLPRVLSAVPCPVCSHDDAQQMLTRVGDAVLLCTACDWAQPA